MRIKQILEQTIPGLGFELVDIEVTPTKLVRVYIDKEGGGLNIDDCAFVSDHLSKLLLVENIDYNRLEVSSPGIERPLRKIADFQKFIGRLARIKTHQSINEQKVFIVRIKEVNNSLITFETEDKQDLILEFDELNKARLIFEAKK